jgi:hypothetical protein
MSSINPNNIDGTYPIAGQDNDSQGFRDNFTNIKNNFTFAASEVSDLQNNAILKSPLSGTTLNNNLNNAQLIGAQISKFTQTRNDLGTQSGSITVNWSDAHFQTLAITANTTVTLGSWPTSGFWTNMVLDVTPKAENLYLSLAGATSLVNATNIQGFTSNAIAFSSGNVTYRLEFSTYDGGTTVSVRDLYRNYNTEVAGVTGTFTTVNAGTLTIGTPLANVRTTGNVIGGLAQFAAVNSTPIGNASPSTGAFTTLSASGDATWSGNVIRAGGQIDSGYQYYSPSGNGAPTGNLVATIGTNVSRLIIDPASTISLYANITLPGGNVDAKVITISSTQNIQFLGIVPNPGTTLVNQANISLGAGNAVTYFYHASETRWYKIG